MPSTLESLTPQSHMNAPLPDIQKEAVGEPSLRGRNITRSSIPSSLPLAPQSLDSRNAMSLSMADRNPESDRTSGLPTGRTERRANSRMSSTSAHLDLDEGFEDLTLQVAIEESYAGPQRPVVMAKEAYDLRKRSLFQESNAGSAETSQAYAALGTTEEQLVEALEGGFDAGQVGQRSRQFLASLQAGLVALRNTPKLFSIVLQKIGSRIRMLQEHKHQSFPHWNGMPVELLVEPHPTVKEASDGRLHQVMSTVERSGNVQKIDRASEDGRMYGGMFGNGYIKFVNSGVSELKIPIGSKGATAIFPRDSASYRIHSMFMAYGLETQNVMRNVVAARGSLTMNLQRIAYREEERPRAAIRKMVRRLGSSCFLAPVFLEVGFAITTYQTPALFFERLPRFPGDLALPLLGPRLITAVELADQAPPLAWTRHSVVWTSGLAGAGWSFLLLFRATAASLAAWQG